MRPLSWHAIGSKRVRRCAAPPPGVTSYQLFHIKPLGYTVTCTGNLCLKNPYVTITLASLLTSGSLPDGLVPRSRSLRTEPRHRPRRGDEPCHPCSRISMHPL